MADFFYAAVWKTDIIYHITAVQPVIKIGGCTAQQERSAQLSHKSGEYAALFSAPGEKQPGGPDGQRDHDQNGDELHQPGLIVVLV